MTKQPLKLKPTSVREMVESDADSESIIVQIITLLAGKTGRISCLISDGNTFIKAFMRDNGPLKVETHQNSLIRITSHSVTDSGKKIGIVEFELICEYAEQIGSPVQFEAGSPCDLSSLKEHLIDPKKIKSKIFSDAVKIVEETKPKPIEAAVKIQQTARKESRMPLPAPKPFTQKVEDFETIKGLFVGLKNWHLVCRIVKLDYQKFTKKNTDKEIRVLNIELMDRSSMKISAAFFAQAADKFHEQLKLNSVYKISQGSIQNQNYNSTKNDKVSPFRLVFYENAQFQEVSDVKIIANQQDSAMTLKEAVEKRIINEDIDVIAILVDIEEPKTITKADKTLIKCDWIVADPVGQITMSAIIWNDKIKADRSLIGKAVLLSRFNLHDYNGSLSLNTKMRSSIQTVNRHLYQQFEEPTIMEYKSYENLSERRGQADDGTICQNIKQLTSKIQTLNYGETIRSDLNVWVHRLLTKKWFYEACNHCSKVAEKGSTCNHCSKFVDQTHPHFLMGMQIADEFGSLWTTAYDDFAKKVFSDDEAIKKLMQYKQTQLKDVVENYLFQEFKLRLYTKKDDQGRIKHNIGKFTDITQSAEKIAQANLLKIKQIMA